MVSNLPSLAGRTWLLSLGGTGETIGIGLAVKTHIDFDILLSFIKISFVFYLKMSIEICPIHTFAQISPP